MGHTAPPTGRREGFQKVFADEARGSRQTQPEGKRQNEFWHRRGRVKGFGTVLAQLESRRGCMG
jgi:hypothetical protein